MHIIIIKTELLWVFSITLNMQIDDCLQTKILYICALIWNICYA